MEGGRTEYRFARWGFAEPSAANECGVYMHLHSLGTAGEGGLRLVRAHPESGATRSNYRKIPPSATLSNTPNPSWLSSFVQLKRYIHIHIAHHGGRPRNARW